MKLLYRKVAADRPQIRAIGTAACSLAGRGTKEVLTKPVQVKHDGKEGVRRKKQRIMNLDLMWRHWQKCHAGPI